LGGSEGGFFQLSTIRGGKKDIPVGQLQKREQRPLLNHLKKKKGTKLLGTLSVRRKASAAKTGKKGERLLLSAGKKGARIGPALGREGGGNGPTAIVPICKERDDHTLPVSKSLLPSRSRSKTKEKGNL